MQNNRKKLKRRKVKFTVKWIPLWASIFGVGLLVSLGIYFGMTTQAREDNNYAYERMQKAYEECQDEVARIKEGSFTRHDVRLLVMDAMLVANEVEAYPLDKEQAANMKESQDWVMEEVLPLLGLDQATFMEYYQKSLITTENGTYFSYQQGKEAIEEFVQDFIKNHI